MTSYVPDRGDIVWFDLNPRISHEQSGHRPFLVLTPALYNGRRGLLVGCPLTSRIKGYAFEVPVAGDAPSVVLVDQVRSLDWRTRGARFKEAATSHVMDHVRAQLDALLGG